MPKQYKSPIYRPVMQKAKASDPKTVKRFKEPIWDEANKFYGSAESFKYKHVMVSLITLKFVSDKFQVRCSELIKEGNEDYLEIVEFYTRKNVFYLLEEVRGAHLLLYVKQGGLAIRISSAISSVDKNNARLKGVLPDNYFSSPNSDTNKFRARLDAVKKIETVAAPATIVASCAYNCITDRIRPRIKKK